MKQAPGRGAVFSAIFGGIALLMACAPGGGLRWLAIALGLVAMVRAIRTVIFTVRAKPAKSTGLFVASLFGFGLGGLAVLVGFANSGRSSYTLDQRQRWQQSRYGGNPESTSPEQARGTTATNFTSNLPIIVLHAAGQDIQSHRSTVMRAQFFDVDAGNHRSSVRSNPSHEGQVSIHVRGSSSQRLPKSSYTLHTVENQTNQVKVPLLGLPKEEDWVLYAPFEDKTLLRDVLAYELARRSGHYAPRTRFVELFVSSSADGLSMDDYAGVYVLIEKIKRGPDRVKIAKLDPQSTEAPDISGGYILKRDHNDRGEPRFSTGHGGPYFFVYPDARRITRAQRTWLVNYFTEFETALYGPDFADPTSGYAAYLDVDSFIDAHWLIEMSKNVDGFRYSAFITKDREGKLKTEPPWDWNRSFGNANYYGGWQPSGWYWNRLRPNEISWFQRLREDPEFIRRCHARWIELRRGTFDPKQVLKLVDELAAQLEEAQARNFARWPILGERVTCNYYVGGTYAEEVAWLKKWIVGRVAWIDRQISAENNSSPTQDESPGKP